MTNACNVIQSSTFFDVARQLKVAAVFVVRFDCASFTIVWKFAVLPGSEI